MPDHESSLEFADDEAKCFFLGFLKDREVHTYTRAGRESDPVVRETLENLRQQGDPLHPDYGATTEELLSAGDERFGRGSRAKCNGVLGKLEREGLIYMVEELFGGQPVQVCGDDMPLESAKVCRVAKKEEQAVYAPEKSQPSTHETVPGGATAELTEAVTTGMKALTKEVGNVVRAVADHHPAADAARFEALEGRGESEAPLGPEIPGSDPPAVDADHNDDSESTVGGKRPTKRKARAQWLAEAMLTVRDHPDWSDTKIAGEANIHPSQLTRSPEYQMAAALARGSKDDLSKGHVTVDPVTGLRNVEAYSGSDGE